MSWLLDTCVLSETIRAKPNAAVLTWLREVEPAVRLCIFTVGEIRHGILRAPASRRVTLDTWYAEVLERYGGELIPFDLKAVEAWARLMADLPAGVVVDRLDGLIAACARAHDLVIATRNIRHFEALGVPLFDPWTGTMHG